MPSDPEQQMQAKTRSRKRRRAVEEPPHSREVIRPSKARTGKEQEKERAVEEPPHSREYIRTRKARRAAEQPRAAFRLSLQTTLLTP
jgi:hypothetical protein